MLKGREEVTTTFVRPPACDPRLLCCAWAEPSQCLPDPSSGHGTNPVSASMVGMQVVVVACDSRGDVDVGDLRAKAERHSNNLAA